LPKSVARQWLRSAEYRARRDAVAYSITADDVAAIWARAAGKCELTGIPFSWEQGRTRARPWVPSLDRVQPSAGYVAGNLRLVVWYVNHALGDYGEECFKRAAAGWLYRQAGLPPVSG